MPLAPGELVGRYRIERRLATGGMGEVWAGEHLDLGFRVAIKRVLPGGAANHEAISRFKREAQLLGRLQSDHVARVLDCVHDDASGLLIVMELVPGESLAEVLSRRRLSPEETIDLGADLASALCDLHKAHIVHRDLKPGNVILRPLPDGRQRAVLIDLGISRIISGASEGNDEESLTGITKTNMVLGTIEYMAPEQILSSRKVGFGADLYALGAILFRAVAGAHVFGELKEGPLARAKLTTDAPPLVLGRADRVALGLAQVVARALERHPTKRYDDAALMLAELAALRDLARAALIVDFESTTTEDFAPSALAAALERGRTPLESRTAAAPAPVPVFVADDTSETITHPLPKPATDQPANMALQPATPSGVVRSETFSDQARRTRRGQLAGLFGGLAAGIAFGLGIGLLVRRSSSASQAGAEGAVATATVAAASTASASVVAPAGPPASAPTATASVDPRAEPSPPTSASSEVTPRAPDLPPKPARTAKVVEVAPRVPSGEELAPDLPTRAAATGTAAPSSKPAAPALPEPEL